MRKIVNAALLYMILFFSPALKAQDLFTSKDLSSIKVQNLSETQLSQIRAQLQYNNLTIDQIESLLLSKGMSSDEYLKLKNKLSNIEANDSNYDRNDKVTVPGRTQEAVINNKTKDSSDLKIFGSDLFDNPDLTFEPNLKLATPLNYVLGPGDELQISLYGVQEFTAIVPVSEEGKISIQHVGQMGVSGITIEAATQKIKTAFGRIYSSLKSGQSKLSVSLNRIRTIKVTIIGSKKPGNYSLSSLATVFNALFLGGGPATNGTYRNIELIRSNKLLEHIDIYKFIVNGDQSENIGLKDNDVIRIPVYNNRVKIEGEVKRPGVFEIKPGETFTDLLSYAAGFNDAAYTASINIIQKTSKEYKVKDLNQPEYNSYQPQPGDLFKISKILNRYENRIKIQGAVFRPETYAFYEGMKIKDLIQKAEGLREDAYTKRAIIVRVKTDLTTEIVNVDITKALIGGESHDNILLNKDDEVTIFSVLDFKEKQSLTIGGEIKNPGVYEFHDNLSLNDLFIQAGGLLSSASKRVEIARLKKAEDINDADSRRIELFNIEIDASNNEQAKIFLLQPFDVINIRKLAVFEKPAVITISGAVTYAGTYVLSNKKETVFDIITRAGGLTSDADFKGVKIKRPIQANQIEALADVNLNLGKKDSLQNTLPKKLKEEVKYAVIPIEWDQIRNNPQTYSNITLLPGDAIEVARRNENVKITGNVLLTSEIPFIKGKNFNYYLNAVGGLDSKAWKKKAYIIYPNGKAAVTNNFLFFKSYPKVTPGSQIVVPEKPDSNKITVGEIVSIASVLVGMTGVVIALFR
jgi:protein involved in polysaccharide export with SLBB domain